MDNPISSFIKSSPNELLLIAACSFTIYLFIILALRLFGKKELSQLSLIDLVFILLISNSVQNAMVLGNNSLEGGIVAATTLFVVNYILKWVLRKFPAFDKVLEGEALMLIYEGEIQQENFDKSELTMHELEAAVREHGVEKIEDVNLAILETDGNISVMSRGFQHKTVRKPKARKGLKQQL